MKRKHKEINIAGQQPDIAGSNKSYECTWRDNCPETYYIGPLAAWNNKTPK